MSEETNCTPSDCEGCPSAGNCGSANHGDNNGDANAHAAPQSMMVEQNAYSNIKNVIAVVSGKGGVGKSLVTASLARLIREQGFEVGILDADITGPSIPKMYGLHDKAKAYDEGMVPEEAKDGTKIMSVNLLLENESDPVVWRSPIITGVVKQFFTDVIWNELDYLFIDMPPGTGDVPLTVFQSIPINGIVIVTSPQDLVQMIVEKAINMANLMKIPVLGIVENYSYITCPDCGKKIEVFGSSKVDELAAKYEVPVLGKIPIDPKLAKAVEEEMFAEVNVEYLADAVNKI
ncbi:MAG: P-loop NTPase [Suipraeoptans sp.]